jgi:hypothetical protein
LHCLVDAGAFEVSITGHNRFVFPAFAVLGAILLLYSLACRRRERARRRNLLIAQRSR